MGGESEGSGVTNDEASQRQFALIASLTPEQTAEYERQLVAHGRAAIYADGKGNVRVLSAAELQPALRDDS